ncbi:hypothetical protein F0562_028173 [Nyssa sinensis]|uniref:Uncharacterized protein n=1 Tax=Nyssa sinensis TaxID=561372 RepID=A0A5J5B5W8_9ASTE|nr:hypothetical protein F0562_028173 [Nyssa sinensis]
MASAAAFKGRSQIDPNETADNTFSTPLIRTSFRRSPSFSSSPSLSSNSSLGSSSFPDDAHSPFGPSSPLRFSGIPFSWEKLPGIPKKQTPKKKDSSTSLLPLPPAGTPIPSKKYNREEISLIPTKKYTSQSFRRDPFFAALVVCSKDDQHSIGNFWKGSKVTRTLSDRFGFVGMNTSCKRTCAVSESIIYLPR